MERDDNKNEEELEATLICTEADIGVRFESSDISEIQHTGKLGQGSRPVIVRFYQRK